MKTIDEMKFGLDLLKKVFSVELVVKNRINDDSDSEDDYERTQINSDKSSDYDSPKKINDPIVPNNNSITVGNAGTVTNYDYVLYSQEKLNMKSIVKYHGLNLIVTKIEDYELIGWYVYYLNNRSDNNV